MTEPVGFSLLNIDVASKIKSPIFSEDSYVKYYFDLSQTIRKEKRQVTSLPVLFGDLGGLYGFFASIAMTLISRVQAKLSIAEQISSLFLKDSTERKKRSDAHSFDATADGGLDRSVQSRASAELPDLTSRGKIFS